jgi:hypothetical protein
MTESTIINVGIERIWEYESFFPDDLLEHFTDHEIEWCLGHYPQYRDDIMKLFIYFTQFRNGWREADKWFPNYDVLSLFAKHGYNLSPLLFDMCNENEEEDF